MQISELKKIEQAPDTGWMLVYTRTEVIFESYLAKEEVFRKLAGQDILEMHLFDPQIEYRCLVSRSKRYEGGIIEAVIDFPQNDEDRSIYKEEIMLDAQWAGKRISVLNHLEYDGNEGMAYIDNYRLVMQEGGEK